jgi:hypothetical protein
LPALILALGAVAALFLAACRGAIPGLAGVARFGVAHGMGTLVRAIVLADRYGPEDYCAIASGDAQPCGRPDPRLPPS